MHAFTKTRIKVLIVEDHSLLIDGIQNLLASLPDYEVVGSVDDGLQAYRACQTTQPDVVLTDLGLPGMDGIDVIHQIKRRWPELTVVVITADAEEHRARAALDAGALAYVLKKSSAQTLLAALQAARLGKQFIDPALDGGQVTTARSVNGPVRLTHRERQVLKLVAEGNRNRDVAEHLSISLKTVETHRLNLMRKLDAHNVAELVGWAHRLGVV